MYFIYKLYYSITGSGNRIQDMSIGDRPTGKSGSGPCLI